MAEIFTPIE